LTRIPEAQAENPLIDRHEQYPNCLDVRPNKIVPMGTQSDQRTAPAIKHRRWQTMAVDDIQRH
jgi:hypothetical protein